LGEVSPAEDGRARIAEIVMGTRERLTILRNYRELTTNQEVDRGLVGNELHDAINVATGQLPSARDESWFDQFLVSHSRHGFDHRNFDPDDAGYAPARQLGVIQGPWSFQEIDQQLDVSRRSMTMSQRFDPQSLAEGEVDQLTLRELSDFLENPPKTFVRRRLNIRLGDFEEPSSDDMEISPSKLSRSRIVRRLHEYLRHRRGFSEEKLRVLATSGDVPDLDFLVADSLRAEVDELTERYFTQIEGWNLESRPVATMIADVEVAGDIECWSQGNRLKVIHVLSSSPRVRKFIPLWVNVLALRSVTAPDVKVSFAAIFPLRNEETGEFTTVAEGELTISPEEGRQLLGESVEHYRRNLRSPLPFASGWDGQTNKFSATWEESRTKDDTSNFLADPYWELLWGHLNADEMLTWGVVNEFERFTSLLSRGANIVDMATPAKKPKRTTR
jgi:exonuclease V gamma subunit